MRITWYGHAAFLLETEGARIILDPFRSPDSGGYAPIAESADIVAVSHENDRYHSHLGQIVPPFEVVKGLELPIEGRTVQGIRFEAVPVFETPERLPGDEVTILQIHAEGMRVVHLGDLGHPLTAEELAPIQRAEIILTLAGGPPTIDFPDIPPLLDAIGPRLVVPMHFRTPRINLKIQPVERFLDALSDWPVDHPGGSSFEVTRETLPEARRIVLLEAAR